MTADLRRRVEAVERAVTDGETDVADVADTAALDARLTDAEARLDELSTRVAHLDATTQALRGYLGGVDDLSDDVERRADLALAKAEALETAVFEGEGDELVVERLRPTDPASATTDIPGTDAAEPSTRPTSTCPPDCPDRVDSADSTDRPDSTDWTGRLDRPDRGDDGDAPHPSAAAEDSPPTAGRPATAVSEPASDAEAVDSESTRTLLGRLRDRL